MTRSDFTLKIIKLLGKMVDDGAEPIIDYVLRGRAEQKRLFDLGRTKCDGVIKLSRHQTGQAMDIYFVIDGQIDFGYNTPESKSLSEKYHTLWQSMGGRKVIDWDQPHYELT